MKASKDFIKLRVEIFVEKDGKEYHAFSPAFKGLHTCGTTVEEALENAKNAIEAYLESLIKHDEPIPASVLVEKTRYNKLVSQNINKFKEDILIPACA